jgi:hypothetical protein
MLIDFYQIAPVIRKLSQQSIGDLLVCLYERGHIQAMFILRNACKMLLKYDSCKKTRQLLGYGKKGFSPVDGVL